MGPCLTLNRPLTIQPNNPLPLRYALWVHAGVPKPEQIETQWKNFATRELPMIPPPRK